MIRKRLGGDSSTAPSVPESPTALSDEAKIRLGVLSDRLLDDPAFSTAIGAVKQRILLEWFPSTSVQQREQLHADTRALARIIQELEAQVSVGRRMEDLAKVQQRREAQAGKS